MILGIIRIQLSHHSKPSIYYTNSPENQETDLKSYLMKIIESFKEDINNLLKKMQENMELTEKGNVRRKKWIEQ